MVDRVFCHQSTRREISWRQVLQPHPRQQFVPDLTGENAGGQQVVGGLVLLITERTSRILLKTMTLAVLHCPQAPMESKPKEEFDLGRHRRSPHMFGSNQGCHPSEVSSVR
jgi:hypothetical protein